MNKFSKWLKTFVFGEGEQEKEDGYAVLKMEGVKLEAGLNDDEDIERLITALETERKLRKKRELVDLR